MKVSKYRSRKTKYGGHAFDSKKEAEYYKTLLWLQKAREVTHIEIQPRLNYTIRYIHPDTGRSFDKPAFYKGDFLVTYKDGHRELVDTKGFRTAEYKRKKKIIETLYQIKIIEK